MNKDDIARMAREAGGLPDPMVFIRAYERFAPLVAAHKTEVAIAEAYRCGHKDGMEAAQPEQEPTWVGCGECDCSFPCTNGQTRCIRLKEKP